MFETYLLPVTAALTVFPLLALIVMLPVAVVSYRRRGRAGGWTTLVFYCFLFYLLAALMQTIVPLPANPGEYCAGQSYASSPQLRPFYVVDVLQTRAQVSGTWLNPALWSTALNVVLLAPLSFFVRYLSGTRFLAATALGFGTSLFLELTQLTGLWFIYPCAYRLFSVDDLILNTAGAVLGWLVAGPLIRLLPDLDPTRDRRRYATRVTASRRLLALLTDVVAFGVLVVLVLGLAKLFGVDVSRGLVVAVLALGYFWA
ncbi:MAG: VanZ family protein, partial [Actinomycetota bacterium]|nr:VanZ family protein [Actinomycetota bacterium]